MQRVAEYAPLLLPCIMALLFLYIVVSTITWAGLKSLQMIFSEEAVFAVKLSLITSLTATIAALSTSIPLAYVLSRHNFRGKSVVETILMIPFAMPPVALGTILLIFFTNTFAGKTLDSLFSIVFEVPGLVVAQYTVILPMMTKILKSTFDMVDIKYEAVARTLGYSRTAVLYKVVLPMSKTGVFSAFILGFSRALGEFGASVTLAGATRFKTETLPIAIYLALTSGDIALTIALLVILLIIAFITLVALNIIEKKKTIMI
ncbi:ABC transporter permease subunit [Desulfurococcaceae archaeon MEX13E-LK6-19]|nr:ABC transporter permease subunit [Desulfurococcaceae archaeon MEX13E-LK6-19]